MIFQLWGLFIYLSVLGCSSSPPEEEDFVLRRKKPPEVKQLHNIWEGDFRYVMSFHSCDVSTTDCSDPWMHRTFLAASNDGSSWGILKQFSPILTSVPDVIVRDGSLYVFGLPVQQKYAFPSGEKKDWARVEVLDDNNERFMNVDPSVIKDKDGKFVLFFLVGAVGGDPAACPPDERQCKKTFRSATEIADSNGAQFRLDPGIRAQVQITAGNHFASDPDIFAGPEGFYMLISRGQGVQVMFSSSLRGTYEPVSTLPNGMLTLTGGGVPAGHWDPKSKKFWIYVTKHRHNKTEIHRVVVPDFSRQPTRQEFRSVIRGSHFFTDDYLMASPGFYSLH